jgi:HEAT repeat protein
VVLSSAETAGLLTNRVTMTRLLGLKNLQGTGDAEAVELIFPLLTDTNKLVQNRAFFVLREITGGDVPENDPAKWQAWWKANKSSFRPKQTAEQNEK